MKKKLKQLFKDKSPYYIANIILISLILFVGVVYSADILNDKLLNIKNEGEYYSQDYFSNKNSGEINSTSSTSTDAQESTSTKEEFSIKNEDADNDSIITKQGTYVQIKDSCNSGFGGECVRARACPALSCPTVISLRDGMVLKTDGEITEADGVKWYHLVFNEWVRYPDRIPKDLYVSSEYLDVIESYKANYKDGAKIENLTNKKIIINLTEQKLYAYDGDQLFMEVSISTGLDDLPTPRGTFHIFEKTPSRYMQGPLPDISDQYYDLPGVPWTMYFTYGGAAVHGAYWHNNFGEQWSHGCVNLRPIDAEALYKWTPMGTTVIVKD